MFSLPQSATPNQDLNWRALYADDQRALLELARDCQAHDGGQLASLARVDVHTPTVPQLTIGGFAADGRLLAAAAVQLESTAQQTTLSGLVHPSARQRNIGTWLMDWSVAQALLMQQSTARPCWLRITNEALTPSAEQLYAQHGFTQQFAEDVMRRDLALALPIAALPPGVELLEWTPAVSEQFFSAYHASFRARPGFPNWSAAEWIAWATDDDFRPQLSLLARANRQPTGFIICAEGWIVQVGVGAEWRRRGLGAALISEALTRFKAAGATDVLLDVNVNNPGAARLYTQLGFEIVARRARYIRELA